MNPYDTRNEHGRIDFEGLPNTRDLGGLRTADGREVRPGLLLRSGTLYFATQEDLRRLIEQYHLRAVVDLRGEAEMSEYPDPVDRLLGVSYLHADVLRGTVDGISQDAETRARLEAARVDEVDPAGFMEQIYPHILLGESGVKAYRGLMRTVLETTVGSVLWHCHVGRDRCGMATMLVLSVLGVPMEAIEEDYLATNVYTDVPSDERTAANIRFIRAAVAGVTAEFGGVVGYVREALGFDESDLCELRGRYLR